MLGNERKGIQDKIALMKERIEKTQKEREDKNNEIKKTQEEMGETDKNLVQAKEELKLAEQAVIDEQDKQEEQVN